jgi:hypothetical protein
MKTLFYQVRWTKKTESIVDRIQKEFNCECSVAQVSGAPTNCKEIWLSVNEKDLDSVKARMCEI